MKLNKIILGVSAVLLCATPTLTIYADSLLTSGVTAMSRENYEYYTTDKLYFQYTVSKGEVTITDILEKPKDKNTVLLVPSTNGTLIALGQDGVVDGNNLKWTTYDETDIDLTSITPSTTDNTNDTSTEEPITELVFPSEIDGMPVTAIGNGSEALCDDLENVKYVEIPDSITTINAKAFEDCTSIESFSIPDTITYIGDSAFENTTWLENQPDGLLYIGKVSYKYIDSIGKPFEISLKDGTTQIASDCFRNSNLTKIVIPESVTDMGLHTFLDCTSLNEVTILNKNTIDRDTIYGSNIGLYTTVNENGETSGKFLEDLTIYCYTGSSAEEFVHIIERIHDVKVNAVYLDTPQLTGDFNNDGSITPLDLMLLKQHILGLFKSINNGDINQDGNINILDVMTLKSQMIKNNEVN